MNLSWKLFFITTPIFVLFLTVFGTWIIQDNFQSGLNQEIERCMAENQTFQNSYELTRNSLSNEQWEQKQTAYRYWYALKLLVYHILQKMSNASRRIIVGVLW